MKINIEIRLQNIYKISRKYARRAFLREPGSMNPADAQTKALGNTKFHQFRKQGNLRYMPETTVEPKHVTFDLYI